MNIELTINSVRYRADLDEAIDITIALDFEGEQPNHFGAPPATRAPFEVKGFTGRTKTGASCNVDELTLNVHCNGTHTETVGHILHEQVTAADLRTPALLTAALVTVTPEPHFESSDSYDPDFENGDHVISRTQLEGALEGLDCPQFDTLIVRTLPNPETKKTWRYSREMQPAFFTIEAAQLIRELEVEHLVVDLPSIDRSHDEGKLTAHRIFWDLEPRSHVRSETDGTQRTITELAFVPSAVADGPYLLSLGIPRFRSDAAPARLKIIALDLAS